MRPRTRHGRLATTVLLALGLSLPLVAQAGAEPPTSPDTTTPSALRQYQVRDVPDSTARTALARTGVSIDAVRADSVVVTADTAQLARLRQAGYQVDPLPTEDRHRTTATDPSAYHSYAQLTAAVDELVAEHADIMSKQVIGVSHEGRDIVAVKISDNAAEDEDEPEVLLTHNQHAREHLTSEMALYTLREFGGQYGTDERVTRLLDEREVWVIPTLNPDGKVHDMESGSFRMWRKNRQPTDGADAVGTDLNRNWAYQWACCGGSSDDPAAETYHGAGPESAPETTVAADFIRSRVVDGEQQITAHIDFHSYSELVLWPYGYTSEDTAEGLTEDDRDAFVAVGTAMAESNGYTPQQSSDLYVTDGSVNDWAWAEHGIFSFAFEMYPGPNDPDGFYPPGSVIERETSRNREAVLILLEHADCVYRAIGKESEYCAS